MIETIKDGWLRHFVDEFKSSNEVKIISPFINDVMIGHLLKNLNHLSKVQIITRFNLNDFRSKVSSLSAIRKLVVAGIEVKGILGLHSKIYLFGHSSVIIGSANFTTGGFFNNYEYGIKTTENKIVNDSSDYFDDLWQITSCALTIAEIDNWEKIIASNPILKKQSDLKDFGSVASLHGAKKQNIYVKFFGKADYRQTLDYHARTEIVRSHCHWAVTFSKKGGHPVRYRDGDIVYMAMMLTNGDYAIFGKGIALQHKHNRDEASADDILEVDWKQKYPYYIRVRDTQFIDSTMSNCPSLHELINNLDIDSFASIQIRHNNGEKNIRIKNSLRQKADVRLSEISAEWLEKSFQEALNTYNHVPQPFIDGIYQGTPTLKTILVTPYQLCNDNF